MLAQMTLEENYDLVKYVIEDKIKSYDSEPKAEWLLQLYIFLTSTKNFDLISFYSNYLDKEETLTDFLELAQRMNIQDAQIDRVLEIKILRLDQETSPELLNNLASYLIHSNKEVLYAQLVEYMLSLIHISEPTRPY